MYVDDLIVMGNSPQSVKALIAYLQSQFPLKSLDAVHFFLGIEIVSLLEGYVLSQRQFILDILRKASMLYCKPITTPMATKAPSLQIPSQTCAAPSLFRSTLGALQYLTIIRPKLAFPVNKLCQSLHSRTNLDFHILKRLLRYL